ncbi:hypothetical protein [Streptomyces lavendofoliae]|uniref:Uncharacterized protein n=1 Tax=Streptomyces lavendofoliae TaxID=67314 RepID=A0A918I269_9ACTN|nr:hypothetical protein [Streptomyces lavendofoliae]GGU58939.1 hypothetical protein GCM10010274_54780 [Streptomyces lavendofoliae]
MSDSTSPSSTQPRYFTKPGEGVQIVHNLKDPTPYTDLGYEEVDEAAYRATLPDPDEPPVLSEPCAND